MISTADKLTIQQISKKYHAKRVLLFGSSLDENDSGHDIDIAVEGINPTDFFRYYGEMMFALSKPVDIIDLHGTSKFINIILRDGLQLND